MANVISIIGMHRSGTSLLTRYLHESGLFVGNDLLGKHMSNPAGHYEDREFLTFHKAILTAHDVDHTVSSYVDWHIDHTMRDRAQSLIAARNAKYPQWGWKDPRTCLFLPFWKTLLPECHYVIIYRSYAAVIRSLISRDILMYRDKTSRLDRIRQRRYRQEEIPTLCNKYLRMWIWYNGEIIRHLIEDPLVRYSFISFDQITKGEFSWVDSLRDSGFCFHSPLNFEVRLTKSQKVKKIPLVFDSTLINEANSVEERFMDVSTTVLNTLKQQ